MNVNTVNTSYKISNAFNTMYVNTVSTNIKNTYIKLDKFIIYHVHTVKTSLY